MHLDERHLCICLLKMSHVRSFRKATLRQSGRRNEVSLKYWRIVQIYGQFSYDRVRFILSSITALRLRLPSDLSIGMVYHAHYRPLNTAISMMLDASASVHAFLPSSLPTPATILRAFSGSGAKQSDGIGEMSPSALSAMANMLTTRPVHVEHVASAIIAALASDKVEGVVDTPRIRELVGWANATGTDAVHT